MASILRKVGLRTHVEKSPRRFRPESESDGSIASGEQSLSDDRDEFTAANSQGGTLSFFDEVHDEGWEEIERRPTMRVPFEGDQARCSERVTFEVTSAEKVQGSKSSFVLYSILITNNSLEETVPSIISKRYSDFDKLNKQLKKHFPALMENVAFPKKKISGNFSDETIAWRSRSFEQYLAHIFSLHPIRHSQEFANFFYQDDVSVAFLLMKNSDLNGAIKILEKVLPVQEKLLGDFHHLIIKTLCGLVVCYSNMGNIRMAQKYSETALSCLSEEADCRYLVPLLETSIRLCWELGKDKHDLELRLTDLRESGLDTTNSQTLEEVFMAELTSI